MLSNAIKSELSWLFSSFLIVFFFAWITGLWLASFSAYFIYYVFRHLLNMSRFERWMDRRSSTFSPPQSGFWEELSYLVNKKQRALEKHADLNLYKSEQFKAASMLIPDAIVSLDKRDNIEWFNPISKNMLAMRHQDIGCKIESVIRQPEFIQYLRRGQFDKALTLTAIQHQSRTFEVRIFSYFEDHKLIVVRDITELYQLAQIRRDFIANASHELRTPLTVLRGYLEVMIDTPGSHQNAWQVPLQHMETQAHRMQAIIEDLLALSTIESGSISRSKSLVLVANLLHQIEKDAKRLGRDNHHFSFDIDDELPLEGYEESLKSLFMNLVSNAVRYSPEGGEIKVRWFKQNQQAVFEVTDQGIGIAQEHIPRLTERFYRVDADRSRGTGGTGLGLAIVKHVLERHNGQLQIDSVVGKGSCFRCVFPLSS